MVDVAKLNNMVLVGRVVSGRGEGKKYLAIGWVQQQVKLKLGFYPFLGTLNLQLNDESAPLRKNLDEEHALGVCQSEGFCTGLLFKASINDLPCGVVIPQVDNYPENLLEIVASENLRQKFEVSDGDNVAVTVFLSAFF